MVDRVADKVVLFLWRALQWMSVLLLIILLSVLVVSVLFPGMMPAGSYMPGSAQLAPVGLPAGQVSSGPPVASPGSLLPPSTVTPVLLAASPVPAFPVIAPARTPLAPSLPHAGQMAARADMEAVMGLASQARWQRVGPGRSAALAPTPAQPPPLPPTPTAPPLPPPTVVAAQPPARIVAPSIGLDAQIVTVKWKKVKSGGREVLSWIVPKDKVGWHFNSALPGQPGNTVLTGHRNIYTEVFRYIVDLKPGDPVTIYTGGQAFVYYVQEQHLVQELGVPDSVRAENARWIARTDDVRLTLITCAPYEAPGNTHRVIVVARP